MTSGLPERTLRRMVAVAQSTAAVFGRDAEREHLATLFARAAAGEPSLCVVHGEAGIGKTALVREACRAWAGAVMWGTCVHFGAATVPFAAVASAVDGWLVDADEDVRNRVLDGLGDLTALLPSAHAVLEPSAGLLLQQLDRAIRRIAEHAPVVLVIDDLQWADPSSLDLLAFLVSGFRTQALSLVVTVREEDRVDGHVLNSWLADLRRLPGVSEQHLARLDLVATAEQVAALTGQAALPAGFTASAFDRSGGNPYLTELLVQAGTFSAPASTASVPVALREALLARWNAMNVSAREVSRLLALAGRPVQRSVLASVAERLGAEWDTGAALSASLTEAVAAGVVQPVRSGLWFRHPLLAEVLAGDLLGHDGVAVHAAYAEVLAEQGDAHTGDVAVHHELAGNLPAAYEWSLAAARSAAAVQGATEHLDHLQRACRLWPQVMGGTASTEERVQLLLRTTRAAHGVARADEALVLVEEALALTDSVASPPLVCRLLMLKHWILNEVEDLPMGAVTEPLEQAVLLAASLPGTAECAIVDSALAWTQFWAGNDRCRDLAAAALLTARTTGSPDALVAALAAAALVFPESDDVMDWLQEAYELAASSGDALGMLGAALGMANVHQSRGDYASAMGIATTAGRELIQNGAPWAGRFLLAGAGRFALTLGRWDQGEEQLRPALASADGGHREAVPCTAMSVLCTRRGDLEEAEQHLARAAEASSTDYRGTGSYPFGRVELLLARGRPGLALQTIGGQISAAARLDPRDADEFLVLAARAAADLSRQGRDHRVEDGTQQAEDLLQQVLSVWSVGATESFIACGPDDHIQIARKALYEAELGRLRDLPEQSQRWSTAGARCHEAGLVWEEALAACRQGQAALDEGRPRPDAATPLREAYRIAVHLGAQPVAHEVKVTAAAAHISLDPVPSSQPEATRPGPDLTLLTSREREVLTHVIAGRTNSEIATALFISDKTVSVHISNILRKTGTTTRVQAAAWASRQSEATHRT